MAYFNVRPNYDGCAPGSSVDMSRCFSTTPSRSYVSHSVLVERATLEDKPVNVGTQVAPCYDSTETISSGVPNPFTNPRLSPLDRYEVSRGLGDEARDALLHSGLGESLSGSSDASDPAPAPAPAPTE